MIQIIREKIPVENTFFCLWFILNNVKNWSQGPSLFTSWSGWLTAQLWAFQAQRLKGLWKITVTNGICKLVPKEQFSHLKHFMNHICMHDASPRAKVLGFAILIFWRRRLSIVRVLILKIQVVCLCQDLLDLFERVVESLLFCN